MSTSEMKIRHVQPQDLDGFVDLCEKHAAYEKLPFERTGQQQRLQTALFGEQPKVYAWVVETDDNQLVGYMSATIDFATWPAQPFVYMDCLYLEPATRGHGIGAKLMDILRQFGASKNCAELQWHTPPDNDLGIAFYRRIGASEKPKLRFFIDSKSS